MIERRFPLRTFVSLFSLAPLVACGSGSGGPVDRGAPPVAIDGADAAPPSDGQGAGAATAVRLLSLPQGAFGGALARIALDGDDVFILAKAERETTVVVRASRGGGAAKVIGEVPVEIAHVALDAANVYVAGTEPLGPGAIFAVPRDGAHAQKIYEGMAVDALAARDGVVFFAGSRDVAAPGGGTSLGVSVNRIAGSGGAAVELASVPVENVAGLTLGAAEAYVSVVSSSSPASSSPSSPVEWSIARVPLSGGPFAWLARGERNLGAVVVRDGAPWWLGGSHAVEGCIGGIDGEIRRGAASGASATARGIDDPVYLVADDRGFVLGEGKTTCDGAPMPYALVRVTPDGAIGSPIVSGLHGLLDVAADARGIVYAADGAVWSLPR